MAELLVLLVCLERSGCNEAASAYYSYNKDLQMAVAKTERILSKVPYKDYVAPLAGAALGYRGSIKLTGAFSLGLSRSEQSLLYARSF